MNDDTFEKAFDDFIQRHEYDEAQNALYSMIRISFKAGWQAAGGEPTQPQPIILFNPKKPGKKPPK